jgi:hypothetical protein
MKRSNMKSQVEFAGKIVGLILTLGGLVWTSATAYGSLDARSRATEKAVEVLQSFRAADHEALVRIEEQLKIVRHILEARRDSP